MFINDSIDSKINKTTLNNLISSRSGAILLKSLKGVKILFVQCRLMSSCTKMPREGPKKSIIFSKLHLTKFIKITIRKNMWLRNYSKISRMLLTQPF